MALAAVRRAPRHVGGNIMSELTPSEARAIAFVAGRAGESAIRAMEPLLARPRPSRLQRLRAWLAPEPSTREAGNLAGAPTAPSSPALPAIPPSNRTPASSLNRSGASASSASAAADMAGQGTLDAVLSMIGQRVHVAIESPGGVVVAYLSGELADGNDLTTCRETGASSRVPQRLPRSHLGVHR